MKVIGYVRVSTEEQANSGVSLAAQTAKLRAYAELYDVELLEVIEDAGQSAKSLNRPGIQRALQLLRTGAAQGLLVAKLDRLTRSVVDMGNLIAEHFGEKGASLLSVSDQIDTRSAGGRLVLNVLMSVAQWEREAIGERTKEALAHKKAQGATLGAPALGTTPDEIETIRYATALRAQGLTLQAVADRLNTEGRRTKRGGAWYPTTVANVLERANGTA